MGWNPWSPKNTWRLTSTIMLRSVMRRKNQWRVSQSQGCMMAHWCWKLITSENFLTIINMSISSIRIHYKYVILKSKNRKKFQIKIFLFYSSRHRFDFVISFSYQDYKVIFDKVFVYNALYGQTTQSAKYW